MSEVIISIRDPYYDMIANGTKTYEFRRRWSLPSARAIIYRSGSKRHICASMDLGGPVRGSASQLRAIADNMPSGCGSDIEKYVATARGGGCGMPITNFVEFEPISLDEMRTLGVKPPQHFTYLHKYPKLKELIDDRLYKSGIKDEPAAK